MGSDENASVTPKNSIWVKKKELDRTQKKGKLQAQKHQSVQGWGLS